MFLTLGVSAAGMVRHIGVNSQIYAGKGDRRKTRELRMSLIETTSPEKRGSPTIISETVVIFGALLNYVDVTDSYLFYDERVEV